MSKHFFMHLGNGIHFTPVSPLGLEVKIARLLTDLQPDDYRV